MAPKQASKEQGRGVPLWAWLTGGGVGLLLLCGCCGGVPTALYFTGVIGPGSGLLGFNKVTMENYDRLTPNMTETQVIAIMGAPLSEMRIGNSRLVRWERGASFIRVTFTNGRLESKDCEIGAGGGAIVTRIN